MKMASEILPSAAEDVGKLQRKASSAVVTRAQSKEKTGLNGPDIKANLKNERVNNKSTSPAIPLLTPLYTYIS